MSGYIKFETPVELASRVLEVLSAAKDGGKIKKGVNETTKAIERKTAKLVVIAEDVQPEEIVIHIPILCTEKGIPFVYVKTKAELGKAIGLIVPTSSIAVEDAGPAAETFQEVLKRIPRMESAKEVKPAPAPVTKEEKTEEKPAEEKKKRAPKKKAAKKEGEGKKE